MTARVAHLAHLEQRMLELERLRRRAALDAIEQPRERRAAIAACCALRIFDAATICMALVICAVPLIDLMRRRRSRGLGIGSSTRSASGAPPTPA